MAHTCADCGRLNAPNKAACIYCGGALPEPVALEADALSVPDDIDQLVRQAMTMGTTHKLQEAMMAHRVAADAAPDEEVSETDPVDRLNELVAAASDAAAAQRAGLLGERDEALRRVAAWVHEWGPLPERSSRDTILGDAEPEVPLPKYRRPHALVLDGPNDIDRAAGIAKAIDVDGVTARMIAIAKQPRIVLRSDQRDRLNSMAETLVDSLGIAAAVVGPAELLACGPAVLLAGFEHGPETVKIADWTRETPQSAVREKMVDTPLLVVPGEVVLLRFRSVRSGGRLKHLREGRMTPSSERRLAVVDLHTPSGVVRMLEGETDVANAPGTVEGSFRKTIRNMLEAWAEQGVRTLEPRSVSPGGQGGPGRTGEDGGLLSTSWPEWEEHSRACRALFIDPESTRPEPAEELDSTNIDPL